jgi:hypothetical protein
MMRRRRRRPRVVLPVQSTAYANRVTYRTRLSQRSWLAGAPRGSFEELDLAGVHVVDGADDLELAVQNTAAQIGDAR